MWNVLGNRIEVVATYVHELRRYGFPVDGGASSKEVVFVLDGVGGFQFAPLMIRRAFRLAGVDIPVIMHRWQFGIPGEIWTDLMWYRRNKWMGAKLARRLRSFRRTHPDTLIHMVAFSGGSGVGVFACERLRRTLIETLVLFCPALSPLYDLAPALRNVRRCYATVSHRDNFILGWGTRTFGTIDRKRTRAAGREGFTIPARVTDRDRLLYQRLREIRWTDELRGLRHQGGHTGWVSVPFLREHLPSMLRGEPSLPMHAVAAPEPVPHCQEVVEEGL